LIGEKMQNLPGMPALKAYAIKQQLQIKSSEKSK